MTDAAAIFWALVLTGSLIFLGLAVLGLLRPYLDGWIFESRLAIAEWKARKRFKVQGLSSEQIEEKLAIGRIRVGFMALGILEAVDWTDEQIKEAVFEFARAVAKCGIDAEELARGLHAVFGQADKEETVH